MATRRAVREGPRPNVPAERIDHSNGKKKSTLGMGETRREPPETQGAAGLVSRFRLTDWKWAPNSALLAPLYLPGGAACLDSLPEEFTLTTASLGDTARHKLFFGHFFLFKAEK